MGCKFDLQYLICNSRILIKCCKCNKQLVSCILVSTPAWTYRIAVRRWHLGDQTMATTILDRLMHRATMLEFDGKSYRLREAAARLTATPSAA